MRRKGATRLRAGASPDVPWRGGRVADGADYVSPCTLRQMRQAQRAAEAGPWIIWWAELAVLAHLTGWPMPFPGPELAEPRSRAEVAAEARAWT